MPFQTVCKRALWSRGCRHVEFDMAEILRGVRFKRLANAFGASPFETFWFATHLGAENGLARRSRTRGIVCCVYHGAALI